MSSARVSARRKSLIAGRAVTKKALEEMRLKEEQLKVIAERRRVAEELQRRRQAGSLAIQVCPKR